MGGASGFFCPGESEGFDEAGQEKGNELGKEMTFNHKAKTRNRAIN
jgi:hypothetical protein